MKQVSRVSVCLLVAGAAWIAFRPQPPAAQAAAPIPVYKPPATTPKPVPPAPKPTDYLPDSFVIARVDTRVIRVFDFRERYFATHYDYRTNQDSAGRVEFLNSMVNKDVLGLTAVRVAPELDFGDRATLREYANKVLGNTLFDALVGDSVTVTDAEAEALYPQYGWTYHLRHILLEDRQTAESVRKELLDGKIGWDAAVKKYSVAGDSTPSGDMGWFERAKVNGEFAIKTFALKPNEISDVVQNAEGYHIVQAFERQEVPRLSYDLMRKFLIKDIRQLKVTPRLHELYKEVRARAGVTYDTTNIRYAVQICRVQQAKWPPPKPGVFEILDRRVTFDPADTGRVLARTPSRRFSIGDLQAGILQMPSHLRPRIYGFEGLQYYIDSMFLGPERVAIARERGLERHPYAAILIDRRRESMMVEQLVQDSVLRYVRVTPEQRRKFYRDNINQMVSRPKVQFAQFEVSRDGAADSLIKLLQAGADAKSMLGPDPARGIVKGTIREISNLQTDRNTAPLFTEVRPGQTIRAGQNDKGEVVVLQLLDYQGEHQLPYEEVQELVDESVRNIEEERLLNAFISRLRKKHRIEMKPELVMKVLLRDPAGEV